MTIERIINKSSRFISVADPYRSDTFVEHSFVKADATRLDRAAFATQVREVGLLPALIEATSHHNNGRPLHIVDCGVYMGLFSVAAGTVARELGISFKIDAYEANPYLLDSIRENIHFYSLSAGLHNYGVSGAAGELRFSIPDGSMVGARVQAKAAPDEGNVQEVTCSIVPLSDILGKEDTCSLVKLDIEGCEVDAFRSIENAPEQLRNLFIVEYAPWQGEQSMASGSLYREWLVENFAVFSLGNWAYRSTIQELTEADQLKMNVLRELRKYNVDLCLVPRDLEEMVVSLRERLPK